MVLHRYSACNSGCAWLDSGAARGHFSRGPRLNPEGIIERKTLGLAVIGSGRIGGLRAQLAAGHPAVRFIATADQDAKKAEALAKKIGAARHSTDNDAIISHPEVNAVIVSTSEGEHLAPILKALELGKPVLVEKPIALSLADADRVIQAIEKSGVGVHVGYSRRYKERYLIAKEQIVQGRIGTLTGGAARVFNSRSQALAMLGRNRHATPVVDALTYYVDLMNWMHEGHRLVEVYARGQKGVLKAAGYPEVDDVSYAILTYDDGAVVNLGVSYALPEKYPALGHAARVEVLGTEGVMILDDDHTDQIMYSNKGIPHVYLPDHQVNMVFLQSGTPGDWALGEFWGPIANETRAWLDHLAMGKACSLATPREARTNLEATLAIEHSIATGRPVSLPLAQ
ncbi:MAG: Gfo/Idh/MocA family oxidoreductase [Burkholderiales bacterium]|nr:Gfo/Idh/MocA family oxidoreductase [Burkholderiales bacterium]